MKTVEEVRRLRLGQLRHDHGTLTALNEKLGLDKRDSTLSQILNSAPNSKTGKGKGMGSPLARRIEVTFKLPLGWMDTDPAYTENVPESSDVGELARAIQGLDDEARSRVLQMCWGAIDLARNLSESVRSAG